MYKLGLDEKTAKKVQAFCDRLESVDDMVTLPAFFANEVEKNDRYYDIVEACKAVGYVSKQEHWTEIPAKQYGRLLRYLIDIIEK